MCPAYCWPNCLACPRTTSEEPVNKKARPAAFCILQIMVISNRLEFPWTHFVSSLLTYSILLRLCSVTRFVFLTALSLEKHYRTALSPANFCLGQYIFFSRQYWKRILTLFSSSLSALQHSISSSFLCRYPFLVLFLSFQLQLGHRNLRLYEHLHITLDESFQ